MTDMITNWGLFILKHVPMVTWVGLSMAAVLSLAYLAKRYRECAVLAGVCAAYACTPYLPHVFS
jgi:hypothetical protein